MDPDMTNCVLLHFHVDKRKIIIPSLAIKRQTSVSAIVTIKAIKSFKKKRKKKEKNDNKPIVKNE